MHSNLATLFDCLFLISHQSRAAIPMEEAMMEKLIEKKRITAELSQVDLMLSGMKKNHPQRNAMIRKKTALIADLDMVKDDIANDGADIISDHAVLRWLERKHKIDINKIRKTIMTPALENALKSGFNYYSDGEVVYVFHAGRLKTVIPVNKLEQVA
jgi:hypothetical protein